MPQPDHPWTRTTGFGARNGHPTRSQRITEAPRSGAGTNLSLATSDKPWRRLRPGAADLDYRVPALREYLREIGPGLRWRGRLARLQDAQMVDDETRVGMAIDERRARVAPEQDVDRANRGARRRYRRARTSGPWPNLDR